MTQDAMLWAAAIGWGTATLLYFLVGYHIWRGSEFAAKLAGEGGELFAAFSDPDPHVRASAKVVRAAIVLGWPIMLAIGARVGRGDGARD